MLKIVLRQHPIAGGLSVAGELLVFFIDTLGGAADFHALGTVGIKRPVRIVLRLTTAATDPAPATATAVAATLTLHSLEISHAFDLLTALMEPNTPGSVSPKADIRLHTFESKAGIDFKVVPPCLILL